MKIIKGLKRSDFNEKFSTKRQCLEYLASVKWLDGYSCFRCGHSQYIKGKQHCSRRCGKCHYDESPTAQTLFHKLKFGIENAFGMMYDILTSKKGANSIWLAERYGVKQITAHLFRQKVQFAMESSLEFPLEGAVHVDEFVIGTPKEGEYGRSESPEKVKVVLAIEQRTNKKGEEKSGRGYAMVIKDYSSDSLSPIFEQHINYDANVVTDGWSGYKPLKEDYPNLKQVLSDNGKNFPMIHIQIRNLKNWLRGVHSYCNKEYLDRYLQEYFYRFNRRNHRKSILENFIKKCVLHEPAPYKLLRIHAI